MRQKFNVKDKQKILIFLLYPILLTKLIWLKRSKILPLYQLKILNTLFKPKKNSSSLKITTFWLSCKRSVLKFLKKLLFTLKTRFFKILDHYFLWKKVRCFMMIKCLFVVFNRENSEYTFVHIFFESLFVFGWNGSAFGGGICLFGEW